MSSFTFNRWVAMAAFNLSSGSTPAEVERYLLQRSPAADPDDIALAIERGQAAIEAGRLQMRAALLGGDSSAIPAALAGALGSSALVSYDAGPGQGWKSIRVDNITSDITIDELQQRVNEMVAEAVQHKYPGDVTAALSSAVVRYIVPEG